MRQDAKKIVKIGALSLFFLFIIIYAFFRSEGLLLGVKIKNVNITNGQTVTQNKLEITGNAKNAVFISLDGREISVDKDGNFDETIILISGYNIVDITARDKFGHEDKKDYQITYTEKL